MRMIASDAGPRILLIEDAPATAAIFQLYVEELGLSDPVWVESLDEAEEMVPRIAAGQFDVIVSDLLLNDRDAGAFLGRVVAETGCPVVVCTGSPDAARRRELAGCTVLTKPVSFDGLAAVLSRWRIPPGPAGRVDACTRARAV